MRLVTMFSAIGVAVAVLFSAYVRLAPSEPATWHVDPRKVQNPQPGGSYLLRDEPPADGPAVTFDEPPEDVLARLDRVAMAAPRVTRLAGDPASGHVTYVARSAIFGFPDYISVVAWPVAGGARLAIYSRLRYGSSDLGVNRKRIESWLESVI